MLFQDYVGNMAPTTSDSRQTSRRARSFSVIVGLVVSPFGAALLGQFSLPRWVGATAVRSFSATLLDNLNPV